MNKLDVQASPVRDPLLMHETGHIRRSNVLRPVAEMIVDLFYPHARGNGRVRHAERATETAAIVGPVQGHQDEAFDLREQISRLVEGGAHDLRGLRQFQATNRAAAVVQCHRVRELRPGEVMDLHNVVQKLDQLVGVLAHVLRGSGLLGYVTNW